MQDNNETVSRRQQARDAQRPDTIPNPMDFSIRVENSGKLHIFDVAKNEKREIEGQVRKDSPDKKNPFLDIAASDRLSFIVIDDATRFLSGLLPVDDAGNKEWFDSTMYRLREDTVTIYMRKKNENGEGAELIKVEKDTVKNLKPFGDDDDDENTEGKPEKRVYKYDFSKMTSCQYIWAFCPELNGLCRVQLSATGRNAYRNFLRKVKKGEMPDFSIVGFEPVFGKDSKTKRQADGPVFQKFVASNLDNERADTYLDKTAAYTKMDMPIFAAPKTETIETAAGDFEAYSEMVGGVVNAVEIPDDMPM